MSGKIWMVQVTGFVSRLEGAARVAVPGGDYLMREADAPGEYVLGRPGGPMFSLSDLELSTYLSQRELQITPRWP